MDFHTNLAEKTLDGETVFQKPFDPEWKEELTDRSCLSVENIFRFAEQVNIEDVREVLSRQIEYNMAIAEEGLNPYGANIGKVLLKNAGERRAHQGARLRRSRVGRPHERLRNARRHRFG